MISPSNAILLLSASSLVSAAVAPFPLPALIQRQARELSAPFAKRHSYAFNKRVVTLTDTLGSDFMQSICAYVNVPFQADDVDIDEDGDQDDDREAEPTEGGERPEAGGDEQETDNKNENENEEGGENTENTTENTAEENAPENNTEGGDAARNTTDTDMTEDTTGGETEGKKKKRRSNKKRSPLYYAEAPEIQSFDVDPNYAPQLDTLNTILGMPVLTFLCNAAPVDVTANCASNVEGGEGGEGGATTTVTVTASARPSSTSTSSSSTSRPASSSSSSASSSSARPASASSSSARPSSSSSSSSRAAANAAATSSQRSGAVKLEFGSSKPVLISLVFVALGFTLL